MGKASFGSKDAVLVSLGVEAGNVEIVAAISKVHQYPPNKGTGEQGEPFFCVQLEFQQYSDKWVKSDDAPIPMEFGAGKLDKFHPGLATSAEDEEPTDQGDELNVEGNCIAVIQDGAKLNKKCKWIMLTSSLEAFGFKPEILGNGYLPDLIGTRGHVKTIPLERMPNSTAKNDPTALVFDRIDVFPYEKAKGATKAPAKAPAKTVAPAKAGSPAPAASSTEVSSDDETVAVQMLSEVMKEQAGQSLETKVLKSKVTAKLMRAKVPVNRHKGITSLVGDPAWLEEKAGEMEFAFDEGVVLFPEA